MFLFIVDNSINSLIISTGQSYPAALKNYRSNNFTTWTGTPNTVLISRKAINCVTSSDSCVLLDQLYTSNGLSANGNSYEDLFSNLLQSWKTKGVDFLKELNGSWALVLHDLDANEIIISTDRFSTYPLWRCELDHSGTAISSDFMALTDLIRGTIDYASLWSFLTRGRPVGQHSFFNEIKAIRPATALLFRKGELVEEVEWYKPKFEPEYDHSVSYWGKELAERLEAAVHDQIKGSSSPGLLLSGGLDSRLVASMAPKHTACFTLADFNNREMRIASKVALICGLKHHPIFRDEDWYPRLLEESAQKSIGLWHWHHMHFLPLCSVDGEWTKIYRVMLAMGFDTLFKGNQVTESILWDRFSIPAQSESMVSFLSDFGVRRLPVDKHYEKIIHPEVVLACRKAYRKALIEELKYVLPMAACIPDAWEMIQFRSIHRVPYFTNLTCLRGFISTRNVIFDNHLYDLYFRIPARIRRTGNVVRSALRQQNMHLAFIADGNSWLPTVFPSAIHSWSRKARRGISTVRNKWYRVSGSKGFKSHGSWPQVGRLWIHNDKMNMTMDKIIESLHMLSIFDIDNLRKHWQKANDGNVNCSELFNSVAGLELLFNYRVKGGSVCHQAR